MNDDTCRITYCTRTRIPRRSYCTTHRNRQTRYGNPHFTRRPTPDETVVERAIHEHRIDSHLNHPERRLISRQLTARGKSEAHIAELLNVAARTVRRWRAADRKTLTTAA